MDERHPMHPWLKAQAQVLTSEEIEKLEMDENEVLDYKKMINKNFLELTEEQLAGI